MKAQAAIKIVIIAFSICLALLSYTGHMDRGIERVGTVTLNSQNDSYLTASFNKALVGFGTMSALKAGLDIIEGSEVGASWGLTANLQVGDIVQPAYDYVDIAWRTLLTGCISLLSIRYLLQAATIIDSYVLGTTFILLGLFLSVHWWKSDWAQPKSLLRDALSVAVVATLALYYILPLSVWGASKLSQVITQPGIEEAQQGFEQTKQALFPAEQQNPDGMIAKLQHIQDRFEQIATFLKDKTKDMVIWSIKLITGYIFDCVVFPLALFTLLLWMTRSTMRYLLQKSIQSTLRDDMARLLISNDKRKTG
jgi:hypothetical protein